MIFSQLYFLLIKYKNLFWPLKCEGDICHFTHTDALIRWDPAHAFEHNWIKHVGGGVWRKERGPLWLLFFKVPWMNDFHPFILSIMFVSTSLCTVLRPWCLVLASISPQLNGKVGGLLENLVCLHMLLPNLF